MRVIKFAELKTIPWKNGGGTTREIAALRENENLIWRLSVADVASDGPFSIFPGLTRILTVIEGNGLLLTMPHSTMQAVFGTPVTFDGSLSVDSRLIDGPIRDLNVMFDPKRFRADVVLAARPLTLHANRKRSFAVMGLQGATLINSEQHLHFGDTAVIDTGVVELSLEETATALVVTFDIVD